MKYIISLIAALSMTVSAMASEPKPFILHEGKSPTREVIAKVQKKHSELNEELNGTVKKKRRRQIEMEMSIDSAVMSASIMFRPLTYYIEPAGRTIRNENALHVLSIDVNDLYVYLPYYQGNLPVKRADLQASTTDISKYTVLYDGEKWTVSFESVLFSDNKYQFVLNIYPSLGKADLLIISPFNRDVKYSGTIAPFE